MRDLRRPLDDGRRCNGEELVVVVHGSDYLQICHMRELFWIEILSQPIVQSPEKRR